ncbi:MAG: hypothetical protein IJ011_09700 [Clostridia bacterium]|nr:hypothetical protein [Clostridia bacterium]
MQYNYILFLVTLFFFPILFHAIADVALRKKLSGIASVSTRLCAFGLSLTSALGAYGFCSFALCHVMTNPSRHPIRYPTSIALMAFSLAAFLLFVGLYILCRIRKPSALGTVIDAVLAVTYAPAWFFVYSALYAYAADIYKGFVV